MKRIAIIAALCVSSLAWLSAQGASEIWVTPVGTDGTGSGTAADPYVRSSAGTFDALLGTVLENSGTGLPSQLSPNTTIHLMAGKFLTYGYIPPQTGWKIRGAGIDNTVIQQVPWTQNPNNLSGIAMFFYNGAPANEFEISDLTIDCNAQNSSVSMCYEAISLSGSENKISRVKAINWGGGASAECFIFGIWGYSDGRMLTNDIIEDSIVGSPAQITFANGADGFTMGGSEMQNSPGSGWIFNSEIRNCVVEGVPIGSGVGQCPYFQAVVGTTVDGFKATGNRVFNTGTGFYSSCGSIYNCVIENNEFVNVNTGVSFAGSDACGGNNFIKNNVQVINNFMTVNNGGTGLSINGYGQSGNVGTNFVITGNSVIPAGSGSINAANLAYLYQAVFQDNILNANGGGPYGTGFSVDSVSTFASLQDNVSSTGQEVIPGGDQTITFVPTSGAGWYRLTATYQTGFSSGDIRVTRPSSSVDNSVTDTEFEYAVVGYTSDPTTLGSINMIRSLQYYPGSVDAVRIGCVSGGAQVYLDVHVSTAPAGVPITIKARGGMGSPLAEDEPIYLTTPVYEGTGDMPQATKSLWFSRGMSTSDYFTANGVRLNDASGLIEDTALNIVDPKHGGLGVDASGWAAGVLPYTTGAGTFGSSAVSSYGLSFMDSANAGAALTLLGLPSNPANVVVNNSTTPVNINAQITQNGVPVSTNKTFFILPPDAYPQMFTGGSLSAGAANFPNSAIVWNVAKDANASLVKPLPLPNDFWGGKTTFVDTWNICTTNAGTYKFAIQNTYIIAGGASAYAVQNPITFTVGAGTNVTTISAANTISTANVTYLDATLYTGDQVQPYNYYIMSGKVTAQ